MTEFQSPRETDIAVIGMSCRFPGAPDVNAFWRNLRDGVESITFFSDEELKAAGVEEKLLQHPDYVKAAGILENIEWFDASFFEFNPREAAITDPQQRLFLECAREALESAGWTARESDAVVGVYAGCGSSAYLFNHLYPDSDAWADDPALLLGNDKDYLATRVSYKLDLRGPGVNIQTACSTSLVAVHMACQSLLNGECDMALAGGVSIRTPQKTGYLHRKGMIHSPDGRCRAFDARAEGTVSGSGVGAVVLKGLEEALDHGDPIHAVIRGSAINNDGAVKIGYTAPGVAGQTAVISEARAVADVEAETITLLEAHGTATELGDPIEIEALTKAFRKSTDKKGFCAIGSVKTNIGHTDAAAGVAGLIKTVLALENRTRPPSLHFQAPNPHIDFANSPFYVNARPSKWDADGIPRRAGVSAFGIGGTNAHVILQEAPPRAPSGPSRPSRSWSLLLLSAQTPEALEEATTRLSDHLEQHPDVRLADVSYTLCRGREHFNHRRAVVCRDAPDAIAALRDLPGERVFTGRREVEERPVVFLFPGSGDPRGESLRALHRAEPVFRERVEACRERLALEPGLDGTLASLLDALDDSWKGDAAPLDRPRAARLPLFVAGYALAHLWMSLGIHPRALGGVGVGEYAAACVAGVFSLEEALSFVVHHDETTRSDASPPGRLERFRPRPPNIPLVSAETGARIPDARTADPEYWLRRERPNGLSIDDAPAAWADSSDIPLIMAPRSTPDRSKGGRTRPSPPIAMAPPSDDAFPRSTLGRLWLAGATVDWAAFFAGQRRLRLTLPTYPFQRRRYWIDPSRRTGRPSSDRSPGRRDGRRRIIAAGRARMEKDRDQWDRFISRHPSRREAMDRACIALMKDFLTNLGPWQPEDALSPEGFFRRFRIAPRHRQLMHHWLNVLAEQEASHREGETAPHPPPRSADRLDARIEEANRHWENEPEWTLLHRFRDMWAALFRDEKEPRELFYSDPPSDAGVVENTMNHRMFSRFNAIISACVQKAAELAPGARIRILETGTGFGLTTSVLLPVLPPDRTRYTCTDVTPFFVERARKTFGAWPFVDVGLLDIERSPREQGYEPRGYDIVIATLMVHATRNIGETLDHIHSLLAPGGLLLAWEITRPQLDFALTYSFVMQPVEDGERSQGHPFLSRDRWLATLREHGFPDAASFPETDALTHNLFVAHAEPPPRAFTRPVGEAETRQTRRTRRTPVPAHPRSERVTAPYAAPRSEVERTIAELWQEMFHVARIGVDDDFFELGGDSLLAVQATARLRDILETDLDAHVLLNHPTISEVAALARKSAPGIAPPPARDAAHSLLETLQEGDSSRPPLFLMHPIGGHLFIYRDLIPHLGPRQPVYGPRPSRPDAFETSPRVETMAARYIEALRARQPEGPYFMAGASFGGILAFEMARQLHRLGQEVALLAMMDTPGPDDMRETFAEDADILAFIMKTDRKIALEIETLHRLEPETPLDQFFRTTRGTHRETDHLRTVLNLYKNNYKAMWSYTTGAYPGKILFFRAMERDEFLPRHPELAWIDAALEGMEIIPSPGSHYTMNKSPHARFIAERLTARLERRAGFPTHKRNDRPR